MLLAVSIMVASGTVSAIVMALAGVYFSAQSSTCEDGADGNITNVILPDNGTDYIYSVDKFDLDGDDVNQKRKEKIKEMMKHAWDNYVKYAWGKNELRPVSKREFTGGIFGRMPFAATILEAMDTLYVMGMKEEFKQARDFVANEFNIDSVGFDVMAFETNARLVGGLLSCFALTGDVVFRDKAQQLVDKLLPAFESPTGIPYALVNFKTQFTKNYGWVSGGDSILSELGGFHLEFAYLSDVTGNPIYRQKVDHIRQVLQNLEKPKGLYPNYLNPKSGKWGRYHMSVGASGDTFYEYLLKAWLQADKKDNEARQMFDDAMQAILQHMLRKSPGGLTYFAELKFDLPEDKMDHLSCFIGGLLALGAKTLENEQSKRYLEVAEEITSTCRESYDRTNVKLGPEAFRFNENVEAKSVKISERYYGLWSEVIESYFVLHRITKNPKYREWGWEVVQALEEHCHVSGGYTGLRNVYSDYSENNDIQTSLFLAETLKYLYLLFSDENLISLDEWVFNTKAHPLPIKGVNPLYRGATV